MVGLSEGWPAIFSKLASRIDLSGEEAFSVLVEILSGNAQESQIGAFLLGLRQKGETADEITGLTRAMLSFAESITLDGDCIDTCGTGGDRSGTINVSTMSAFVVAGTGLRVVKHGNRAASSSSGSADLLEALGVVTTLDPSDVKRCIESVGMGFCFAPRFHPAMKFAGPVRSALGIPTVFNFLGPLANPARVPYQVVGVSDHKMAPKMAMVLRNNGIKRALVVYGHDGLDELSTTSSSTVIEVSADEVKSKVYDISPGDYGIELSTIEALRGGDAQVNAAHTRQVLAGVVGPHFDIVILNAGAALYAAGRASSIAQGIEMARESIQSGKAAKVLEDLRTLSQQLASGQPSE